MMHGRRTEVDPDDDEPENPGGGGNLLHLIFHNQLSKTNIEFRQCHLAAASREEYSSGLDITV
jgi:hypothetical protein